MLEAVLVVALERMGRGASFSLVFPGSSESCRRARARAGGRADQTCGLIWVGFKLGWIDGLGKSMRLRNLLKRSHKIGSILSFLPFFDRVEIPWWRGKTHAGHGLLVRFVGTAVTWTGLS